MGDLDDMLKYQRHWYYFLKKYREFLTVILLLGYPLFLVLLSLSSVLIILFLYSKDHLISLNILELIPELKNIQCKTQKKCFGKEVVSMVRVYEVLLC